MIATALQPPATVPAGGHRIPHAADLLRHGLRLEQQVRTLRHRARASARIAGAAGDGR